MVRLTREKQDGGAWETVVEDANGGSQSGLQIRDVVTLTPSDFDGDGLTAVLYTVQPGEILLGGAGGIRVVEAFDDSTVTAFEITTADLFGVAFAVANAPSQAAHGLVDLVLADGPQSGGGGNFGDFDPWQPESVAVPLHVHAREWAGDGATGELEVTIWSLKP